jgi:hypothetical protein
VCVRGGLVVLHALADLGELRKAADIGTRATGGPVLGVVAGKAPGTTVEAGMSQIVESEASVLHRLDEIFRRCEDG